MASNIRLGILGAALSTLDGASDGRWGRLRVVASRFGRGRRDDGGGLGVRPSHLFLSVAVPHLQDEHSAEQQTERDAHPYPQALLGTDAAFEVVGIGRLGGTQSRDQLPVFGIVIVEAG